MRVVDFILGYKRKAPDYADIMTVAEFKENCESGGFIDYDGFGHPVRGGFENDDIEICPSGLSEIPTHATHIAWYNR